MSLVENEKLVERISSYIRGSVDDVETDDARAIAKAVIKMVEDEVQKPDKEMP